MDVSEQHRLSTSRGPHYESNPTNDPLSGTPPSVRLIAFYLPQFHPIPLNDKAWGEGFTEWTNVSRALPRYVGHLQPRLPSALGFYDLRRVETLREQAALARRFGIHGFCFHHYWFSGETLLETPLNNLLANRDIELPFCINWANESWTRSWDGAERDVLMAQRYEADDPVRFADAITPMLRDPRYIRVDGRPLVLFYRPAAAPDASRIISTWRERLRHNGIGECYLVMPQTFDDFDPRPYGLDAACGFPPHNVGFSTVPINGEVTMLDHDFAGEIHAYDDMVRTSLAQRPSDYAFFPGVCPSWDNEARRAGRGFSFSGSQPSSYERWLAAACEQALAEPAEHRLVFINAWNEWAEGAHLEPDLHHGYAYLAATARALRDPGVRASNKPPEAKSGPEARDTFRQFRLRAARALESLARLIRP